MISVIGFIISHIIPLPATSGRGYTFPEQFSFSESLGLANVIAAILAICGFLNGQTVSDLRWPEP